MYSKFREYINNPLITARSMSRVPPPPNFTKPNVQLGFLRVAMHLDL